MKTAFLLILFMVSITVYSQDSTKNSEIIKYFTMEREQIPDSAKWKIEDVYSSNKDWEHSQALLKNWIQIITEKSINWTSSSVKFYEFLNFYEDIHKLNTQLYNYALLQSGVDLNNQVYANMLGEMEQIQIEISAKLSFMNSDILVLGDKKIEQYIKENEVLKDFEFMLKSIVNQKDHVLSPEIQKIVSLKSINDGLLGKISLQLNSSEIPRTEISLSNNKNITLDYNNYLLYRSSISSEDRTNVMKTFWENQKKFEKSAALLIEGLTKQHYAHAQIYNYNSSLEAALDPDQISTDIYINLIQTVKSDLNPMHKYLLLKKKIMGNNTFNYEDIYASAIPEIKKVYSYNDAKSMLTEVSGILGKEYSKIIEKAFSQGWIDYYPGSEKYAWAYALNIPDVHPYVHMVYNEDYNSLSTLFHELGHASHYYLSYKNQSYTNSEFAGFISEIPSTLNEFLLMRYLLDHEEDDMFKLNILSNYLELARNGIYRQSLFAEFELARHNRIEEGKSLSAEWLNKKYLELTRYYYGHDSGVCYVDDFIQSEWTMVPNLDLNFYVYQYCTGMIATFAFSDQILNNKNPKPFLKFIESGSANYPLELLKQAGIDLADPKTILLALDQFDMLVDEMEEVYIRLKNQGVLD